MRGSVRGGRREEERGRVVPDFRVGRSPKRFTRSGDMLPVMFYRTGGLCLRSDVIDTLVMYTALYAFSSAIFAIAK